MTQEMMETAAGSVDESLNTALNNEADSTADQNQEPPKEDQKPEETQKTFTQDELDKIVQKRLAKESRRIERLASVEAENRILREQMTRNQPQAEQTPDVMPQPEGFKTYEAYIAALTDWKVDQRLASMKEETAKESQERQEREREIAVRQKMESAAQKHEDFEEVALNPNVPITQHMALAIGESDIGGDVAYYLGSNIAEAKRISGLSPIGQVRAIAQLEAKLSAPDPVVSKAPKPIQPLSANKGSTTGLSDDLPMDEWLKRRNAETRRKR